MSNRKVNTHLDYTKHESYKITDTFCGQNVQFLHVRPGGRESVKHWTHTNEKRD